MYLMHFIKTIKDFATTKDLIAEFSYPIGLDIENPYVVRFKHMDTGEPLTSYAVSYKTFDSHANTDVAITDIIARVEQDLRPTEEEEEPNAAEDSHNDIFVWFYDNLNKQAKCHGYEAWSTMREDGVMDVKFMPMNPTKPVECCWVEPTTFDTFEEAKNTLFDLLEDLRRRTNVCPCRCCH